MRQRTKEFRRFNAQKFKKRCQKFVRNLYFSSDSLADDSKFIGKLFRTRKACSCFMCGNPRKYSNKRTIKEIRQEQI